MKKLKTLFVGAVVALASFAGYALLDGDTTKAMNPSARDCDGNSVIYCGAITPSELKSKYNANKTGDLDNVYSNYGVSSGMINGMTQKMGKVTREGDVVYNGKVVATNTYSLGRHYRDGSTKVVLGGHTFWKRKTGAGFASGVDAIAAHLWFDAKGQFVGGVMYSCGNPIIATPVPVPVYSCDNLSATKITRTEYKFTTAATAKNGATAYNYAYDFGDGTKANGGATINHTYAKPGTYTATVTFQVKVDGAVKNAPAGHCSVQVVVAPEPCPIPGKEHLPKDSPLCVEDKPGVDITKSVNGKEHDTVAVNENFTYQIVVKNTGNVALKNVVVTDKQPAGVTFVSASEGTIANGSWTHTLAELNVGASKTYTITAKITKYLPGVTKNTACVETPTVPGGNPDDCDDATTDTPHMISVCDTTTDTIIKIDEKDMKDTYTTDLSKCDKVTVCDTTTGQIITIVKNDMKDTYTTDLDKCEKIEVCRLEDKKIVVITKDQLDATKYSEDKAQCAPAPVNPKAETPTELPHTGIVDAFGGSLGLGSIAGAMYHYGASRRELRKAQLKR